MNQFAHLMPYDKSLVRKRWKGALVVIDTCVLLRAYRSKRSAEMMATLIEKLSDDGKLRMPNQIAFEFFKNRLSVIKSDNGCHADINEMQRLVSSLEKAKDFESLKPAQKKVVESSLSSIRSVVKAMQKEFYVQVDTDSLAAAMLAIPEENYLKGIADEDSDRVAEHYKARIERFCPPGLADYQDKELDAAALGRDPKYGDCFIWEEILHLGRVEKCDVVFVTQDLKDGDWVWPDKVAAEMHLAHPLLRKEYGAETEGHDFLLIDEEMLQTLAKEIYGISLNNAEAKRLAPPSGSNDIRYPRTKPNRAIPGEEFEKPQTFEYADDSLESMYAMRLELSEESRELSKRAFELIRKAEKCDDEELAIHYRSSADRLNRKRQRINRMIQNLDRRARLVVDDTSYMR